MGCTMRRGVRGCVVTVSLSCCSCTPSVSDCCPQAALLISASDTSLACSKASYHLKGQSLWPWTVWNKRACSDRTCPPLVSVGRPEGSRRGTPGPACERDSPLISGAICPPATDGYAGLARTNEVPLTLKVPHSKSHGNQGPSARHPRLGSPRTQPPFRPSGRRLNYCYSSTRPKWCTKRRHLLEINPILGKLFSDRTLAWSTAKVPTTTTRKTHSSQPTTITTTRLLLFIAEEVATCRHNQ